MITRARRATILGALLAIVLGAQSRSAQAQCPEDALRRGLLAYQALDFADAAQRFRALLRAKGEGGRPCTGEVAALTYLGAVEFFVGHRDSAQAAFRTLVIRDPGYRLDELIFSPEVTSFYEAVRSLTKAVAVRVPAEDTLTVGQDSLEIRVIPSSPHRVAIVVAREGGQHPLTLYTGTIADTLRIPWDGLPADSGQAVTRRVLTITSMDNQRRAVRMVRLPLEATFLPDSGEGQVAPLGGAPIGDALTPLAAGIVTGAAALLLPTAVGAEGQMSAPRFVVAAALAATGVVGFVSRLLGSPPGPSRPVETQPAIPTAVSDTVAALRRFLIIRAGTSETVELREGVHR